MPHRHNIPRLLQGFVFIILCLSVVLSFMAGRYIEYNLRQQTLSEVQTRATLLAELLTLNLNAKQSIDDLHEALDLGSADRQFRYTIIDDSGNVLLDTHAQENAMDNHGLRPEVFIAQENGAGYSERFSNTLQQEMIYYAIQVTGRNANTYYARASRSIENITHIVALLRFLIFALSLVVGALAVLMGYYVYRIISKELEAISTQADNISRGNYKRRIYTSRPQEVGQLVDAVNRLAKNAQWRVSEISAERNQLAAILSSMVEGVIALDHKQCVLHINNAAAQLFNVNPLRAVERPLWEHVRHPQIQSIVENVFANKEDSKTQLSFVQDGAEVIVDIYATAFINRNNDDADTQTHEALQQQASPLLGAVLVLHDISTQKKLETVRRDFVANASHELKTPLAAIRGLAETIEDDPDMPADLRHGFIKKINKQIQRLSLLLSELLDLSKLESKNTKQALQNIDVCAIAQRIKNDLQPQADEKGLELNYHSSDSHIYILAGSTGIEQMLQNLLVNAIKYTQRGAVSLVIQKLDDEQQVEIKVIDSGEGISAHNQQRVFERFYRVDRARSRELGGNGLGLAIVKHIVDQHQGTIHLHSQLGKGSEFIVRLPLSASTDAK